MSASEHADELDELLSAAKVPTPVIIVAHSYGGLVAVQEAVRHPETVLPGSCSSTHRIRGSRRHSTRS
jgi:pimeloyl-ACP methyl ester carboxylesterase